GEHVANSAACPVHRIDGEQLGQVSQTYDRQGSAIAPGKQTGGNGGRAQGVGIGPAGFDERAKTTAQDGPGQGESRQGGHRHEAAKKGSGHLASGQGAESQRGGAGEYSGQ